MWSIETWCASQVPSSFDELDESAIEFLTNLNATIIHPFCVTYTDDNYHMEGVPSQGPLLHHDHLETMSIPKLKQNSLSCCYVAHKRTDSVTYVSNHGNKNNKR